MRLSYSLTQTRPMQIGLIVLQADETLEHDMRRLLPPDVEYLVSRIPSAPEVTAQTLASMEGTLTQAASLLPRAATCAAVGYGCTSASAHIGPDQVSALIRKGVNTDHVTDPMTALIAACGHLGIRRIGIISPYIASVSDQLRVALNAADIDVVAIANFEEPLEERVVRIAPEDIAAAAVEMGKSIACDAVFLSCTNLRTLDVIAPVEAAIGKPVLSSNQVLAWHLGALAGFRSQNPEYGLLFGDSQPA